MSARRRSPVKVEVTEAHMCSVDVRMQILGKTPFFKGLAEPDLQAVNLLFHETGYAAGDTICAEGDPAEKLFILADGRVRLLRRAVSGKEIVLDILAPGDFFGTLATGVGETYLETAQAHTPACVLGIERQTFRGLLDRLPGVALKVLDVTAARLNQSNARIQQLSTLPVEGRIASVLLRLSERFGEKRPGGVLIQTPLSRSDLAAMTGATTESASRVISQFQKDGWVEAGREWILVKKREKLEEIAVN